MEERGMNQRIRRLRNQSLTAKPHLSIERAMLVTEVYEKYLGTDKSYRCPYAETHAYLEEQKGGRSSFGSQTGQISTERPPASSFTSL